MRNRADIYQEVTDSIVRQLENGVRPWAKSWQAAGPGFVLPVRANAGASGGNWLGLRTTNETELLGVTRYSLFSGFLGLALLLIALAGTWMREGR